jgi:outer membrane lipoprotein-sorting protein
MSVHSTATRLRSTFMLLALGAAPALASAQTPAAPAGAATTAPASTAAGLPDAKTIIADFVKAIGGRDATDKVQSIHMTGTFEMPAMGVSGTVDAATARPNKQAMAIAIPGLGDVSSGSDGTVVWSNNPMAGPTLVTGKDLTEALEDASFGDMFKEAGSYESVETVEKTTLDGKACYKVKVTRKSGHAEYDCYDVDTHLIVGSSGMPSEGGESVQLIREYKSFGGIMFPVKMAVTSGGQEQVVTFTNIEINTVAPSKFDLPPAIKALIK